MDDVNPLRRRMIDDMTVRNLSPRICQVVRSLLAVGFAEASLQGWDRRRRWYGE